MLSWGWRDNKRGVAAADGCCFSAWCTFQPPAPHQPGHAPTLQPSRPAAPRTPAAPRALRPQRAPLRPGRWPRGSPCPCCCLHRPHHHPHCCRCRCWCCQVCCCGDAGKQRHHRPQPLRAAVRSAASAGAAAGGQLGHRHSHARRRETMLLLPLLVVWLAGLRLSTWGSRVEAAWIRGDEVVCGGPRQSVAGDRRQPQGYGVREVPPGTSSTERRASWLLMVRFGRVFGCSFGSVRLKTRGERGWTRSRCLGRFWRL